MLDLGDVLLTVGLVSALWAKVGRTEELWNELLRVICAPDPPYYPSLVSSKQACRLKVISRNRLAVFRINEILLFDCKTEVCRQYPLRSASSAVHCTSVYLPTGDLLSCGGLEIVPKEPEGLELSAAASAFLLNIESGSLCRGGNMRTARHSHGMVCYTGSVFAFGGVSTLTLRKAEEYQIATKRWHSLPSMNHPRRLFNPCARSDSIYLCGGVDCDSLELFSIPDRKYTVIEIMLPVTRCWQCASVLVQDELVYVTEAFVMRMRLAELKVTNVRRAELKCAWQDSSPQYLSGHIYYQHTAGIGRLSLSSFQSVLIALPPPILHTASLLDAFKSRQNAEFPIKNA